MCLTCGCGNDDDVRVLALDVPDHHHHGDHHHDHHHEPSRPCPRPTPSTENLIIGEAILAKNDHLAQHNRDWFAERGITALNLMSSPGSGKTSLLERTIAEFGNGYPVCVIEGDQETTFDAERIRRAGARAVQVNTGAGCHLDAPMVQTAVEALNPEPGSWLFIENVGNLVCPALFDVGEHAKVVIISVTEGQDKPLKYPAHVLNGRPGDHQQDRSAALRRLRRSSIYRLRTQPQPQSRNRAPVSQVRRRSPGLVCLATPAKGVRGSRLVEALRQAQGASPIA